MAVLKQKVTEDHIKVAKQLVFTNMDNVIFAADETGSPFGGTDISEDIDTILVGLPEGGIDPFKDPKELDGETREYYLKLYAELPNVLEIILQLGTFETGHYKRRKHIQRGGWKKYTPTAQKYAKSTVSKK